MQRLFRLLILTTLFVQLGCKSPEENPHLLDPIYTDFIKEQANYENRIKAELKSLEVSKKELAETEPRSLDRKIKQSEVNKTQNILRKLEQRKEYYRIKAELRRAYGKKEYLKAFEKGEAWPKPEDVRAYRVNKQIRQTPRKWSVRVPGSPHFDEKLASQTVPNVQSEQKK